MNKQVGTGVGIAVIVVIALAIAFAVMWNKGPQAPTTPAPTQTTEQVSSSSTQGQIQNQATINSYRNDKYGFQIKFPESWKSYSVKTDVTEDKNGIARINLSIPIQGKDIWVYNIAATPIAQWTADACKGRATECKQGALLGKNSKYAFDGTTPVYMSGDPCTDGSDDFVSDKNFCSVYKDIDKNNFAKNNFSVIDATNSQADKKAIQDAVFSAVNAGLKSHGLTSWDKKVTTDSIDPSQKAAKGKWYANDAWPWLAWQQTDGTWAAIPNFDGFDCNQLKTVPSQFNNFFKEILSNPAVNNCIKK